MEVSRTGSPYFERAICFVRPEYAQGDRVSLHRAAQKYVTSLDKSVEESASQPEKAKEDIKDGLFMRFFETTPEWAKLSLSGVLGAILAVIMCFLLD